MILIKNAKVYPVTSNPIDNCDILIDNGKIIEVNKNINNAKAIVIDATNLNVFPGFIDGHTHLGIGESSIGFEGRDYNEMSDPVTPHLRAIDAINPDDITFSEAYQAGITTVASGPGSANVVGGQYSCIKTYGKRIDDMILKESIGMKCAFGENPKRVYNAQGKTPMTRMAIAGLLRELLFKSKEYLAKKDAGKDVDFNIKYEAMIPVLRKELPLKVHAHRADDMYTAMRIAEEFNLDMTLDHCTEGHLIAKDIKARNISAFVGPSMTSRSKFELKNRTFETPSVLVDAGVEIAIVSDAPVIPLEYLPVCVGLAIKSGLSFEDGLKSITINPARFMNVDDRVGSIEIGKDADLVITDGNPFVIETQVHYTLINGELVYQK